MKARPEQDLQIACCEWFALQYANQRGRLYMNYNNPPSAHVGAILKRAGLLAGIADLTYLRDGGRVVFIELKTTKGTQSPNQKEFEQMVVALGFEYIVVRSFEEFVAAINSYQ